MIVNYASSIVNKLGASLTDIARVVIYDRHVFIVQATDLHCTIINLGTCITLVEGCWQNQNRRKRKTFFSVSLSQTSLLQSGKRNILFKLCSITSGVFARESFLDIFRHTKDSWSLLQVRILNTRYLDYTKW